MGWVIRDPRIIWWGGRGGFLDPPRISDPRTAYHTLSRQVAGQMTRSNFSTCRNQHKQMPLA